MLLRAPDLHCLSQDVSGSYYYWNPYNIYNKTDMSNVLLLIMPSWSCLSQFVWTDMWPTKGHTTEMPNSSRSRKHALRSHSAERRLWRIPCPVALAHETTQVPKTQAKAMQETLVFPISIVPITGSLTTTVHSRRSGAKDPSTAVVPWSAFFGCTVHACLDCCLLFGEKLLILIL